LHPPHDCIGGRIRDIEHRSDGGAQPLNELEQCRPRALDARARPWLSWWDRSGLSSNRSGRPARRRHEINFLLCLALWLRFLRARPAL